MMTPPSVQSPALPKRVSGLRRGNELAFLFPRGSDWKRPARVSPLLLAAGLVSLLFVVGWWLAPPMAASALTVGYVASLAVTLGVIAFFTPPLTLSSPASQGDVAEKSSATLSRPFPNQVPENRLSAALGAAKIGIWEYDVSHGTVACDPIIHELYGLGQRAAIKTVDDWLRRIHPADILRVTRELKEVLAGNQDYHENFRIVWPDGSIHHLCAHGVPVRNAKGEITGLVGTNWDITEERIFEEKLQTSEERFRLAVETSSIGFALAPLYGPFLSVNPSLCAMLGYTAQEFTKLGFREIIYPDDYETRFRNINTLFDGVTSHIEHESRYLHRDGHVIWGQFSLALVRKPDGTPVYFIVQIQDITKQRAAQLQIKASLEEKDVLLREIHHRVKNNLQVISSLLQLYSSYVQHPADLEVFKECQLRIRSMALVHNRLYNSGSLSTLNFGEHLTELARLIAHSQARGLGAIELQLDCQPISLSLDAAIPLGLVATEMVANAYKHAFPNRQDGRVLVSLRQAIDGPVVLSVQDNGCGLPTGFDIAQCQSLGMQLIENLTRQMRAEFHFSSSDGTLVQLMLPPSVPQTAPTFIADVIPH